MQKSIDTQLRKEEIKASVKRSVKNTKAQVEAKVKVDANDKLIKQNQKLKASRVTVKPKPVKKSKPCDEEKNQHPRKSTNQYNVNMRDMF